MEINHVTLQKLMETMPLRTCAVIKAKGGLMKFLSVTFFLARLRISIAFTGNGSSSI